MSKIEQTIVALLSAGPVPFREVMNGRRASFQLAYRRLVRNGTIVESGMGTKADPKYVGLPGADYPEGRVSIRSADVKTLVRSGVPREEAKARLAAASREGMESVLKLLGEAHDRIIDRGVGLTFRYRVEKPRIKITAEAVEMALQQMKRSEGSCGNG